MSISSTIDRNITKKKLYWKKEQKSVVQTKKLILGQE